MTATATPVTAAPHEEPRATRARASCAHCGLPLGPRPAAGGGDALFCCSGCAICAAMLAGRGALGSAPTSERPLARVAVAAFFAMNVMTLSLAVSSEVGFDRRALAGARTGGLAWLAFALSVPVFALTGPALVVQLARDVRAARLGQSALFTLGVAASVALSIASLVQGHGPTFFETATMLLVLYAFGRYVDARTRTRAAAALSKLADVAGTTHLRVDADGVAREVRDDALAAGDVVRLRAGDVAPVDGRIERGQGLVDESALTGEATPITRGPSAFVAAGARILDATLDVRVTLVGADRSAAKLRALVREARARPSRSEQLADLWAARLSPVVVVVAAGAGAIWYAREGAASALLASLSVVLISCPCALGLATPLVAWVAIEAAARAGVLVRGGDALERLARVRAVAFDKTGTLTERTMELVAIAHAAGGVGEDEALALAASLEQATHHPYASSVAEAARARGVEARPVRDGLVVAGVGVEGWVTDRAGRERSVRVTGKPIASTSTPTPTPIDAAIGSFLRDGHALLYLHVDGALAAVFAFRERLQPGARALVNALVADGIAVTILTGDAEPRTTALARSLGVPARAALTPEAKVRALEDLRKRHGAVAMIGDGVNDAAVLAYADVGIALGSGAPAACDGAHITLLRAGLEPVLPLLALARRADRTMKRNLTWAFGYNLVGMALAVAGLLHPIVSMLIMTASSVLVVRNAARTESSTERA